ncbi:MBL fold metallo-hydrolase [Rhodanobacter sp. AS-Z3]|uniref:MBL fold metallo-hydrolase n=1 Tax=Rhodanobacter sp. AS-Z3 TaxID=3031330 RepID=UPI00247A8095|nr:MBL fold metallo-hydrolase [Rhodanobacter sp. AS-Z3]WEN15098.1 MBL fold metallo-hydrolase [Rhodanobacter sp. AS-Z3]
MNTTDTDQVYLASDTKLEPLVFNWYAWSHLVSPITLALNLANRHLPMLKSFIANPAVHEAASTNPKMLGGSFLELGCNDVAAVRVLQQHILDDGAPLIGLADDLFKLDRNMQQSATGYSLDHLYDTMPASLAGMIEVTYDLNNRPALRVLEELMVGEAPTNAAPQQLAFTRTRDEKRNFFLNTPRLPTSGRMILPAAFAGPAFDIITQSRIAPVSFRAFAAALDVKDQAELDQLREYFVEQPPRRNEPAYAGDDLRVRYFGHACILLQTDEVCILIDPFLTWDNDDNEGRLTFHDLPDHIDYVFLTHNHQDHFSIEVLLQLRNRIGQILVPRNNANNFADPSMKIALAAIGHRNVAVMDSMDRIELPGGHLYSLPFLGEHADLSIASKHGLCIELKGCRILLLADSDCKDRMLYRRIAARVGRVDHLFIGMECDGAPLSWMYGPYFGNKVTRKDDESRRLSGSDCEHAWAIVEEFRCNDVYVYAMGQEPWMRFVAGLQLTSSSKQIVESERFITRCRDAGHRAERLHGCRTFVLHAAS